MLLGVIALLLSVVQFTLGPFSTKSTALEVVVAEKVTAVKKGIMAGLKGEQPTVETKKKPVDIDRLLIASGILLSVMALGLAFISGLRKENKWTVSGALFFSGATIALHAALLAFGLIVAVLVLMLVVSIISGSTPF